MVQPQELSCFTHGQPLVHHRESSLKIQEGPTMSGCPASLSSGAQTPCTVPVHTSRAITLPMESVITLLWNGRSLSNGIGDHFAVEWVITLPWNPHFRTLNNVASAFAPFEARSRGLHALCVRFAAGVAPGPRNTRFRLVANLDRSGLSPAGSHRWFTVMSFRLHGVVG